MKNKPSPNGRNAKSVETFSMIPTRMQQSQAYRSLSANSLRLLVRMVFEASDAARKGQKKDGMPVFMLTNDQANERCRLSADAFSRAKNELHEKGFLEWYKRGGLQGVNGTASEFYLTDGWKHWTSPAKPKRDTSKAREALQAKRHRPVVGI